MKLREKIADVLWGTDWRKEKDTTTVFEPVDAILAIPEIAEALEARNVR